jgi:hypothetical protein
MTLLSIGDRSSAAIGNEYEHGDNQRVSGVGIGYAPQQQQKPCYAKQAGIEKVPARPNTHSVGMVARRK